MHFVHQTSLILTFKTGFYNKIALSIFGGWFEKVSNSKRNQRNLIHTEIYLLKHLVVQFTIT